MNGRTTAANPHQPLSRSMPMFACNTGAPQHALKQQQTCTMMHHAHHSTKQQKAPMLGDARGPAAHLSACVRLRLRLRLPCGRVVLMLLDPLGAPGLEPRASHTTCWHTSSEATSNAKRCELSPHLCIQTTIFQEQGFCDL